MSIRLKPGQMATLDKPYRVLRHRYNDFKKCRHKLVGANSPGSFFNFKLSYRYIPTPNSIVLSL